LRVFWRLPGLALLCCSLVLGSPFAARSAWAETWEVSACRAWKEHLDFVIAVRMRSRSGETLDLGAVQEAVNILGRRCDAGHSHETSRLFAHLLDFLTDEDEGS
jgi:hypothetical protein